MVGACSRCGAEVSRAGRGRMRRYCSDACKQAAYRERQLPDRMRDAERWTRADGKRPIDIDGYPASSTDPGTWSTFDEVRTSSAGDGMGIMLGAGIGCYDLDHVTDKQAIAFARTIKEPILFAERSMSGEGAHIFVEAPEARGWRRTIDGISVERYTRQRFIRVTGARLDLGEVPMADELSAGARLRAQYAAACEADAALAVLVDEAARISDRLDQLDDIVTGKSEWIELMHFRVNVHDEQEVHVKIDGVLAEARQQATALRTIVHEIILRAGAAPATTKPVSVRDELAKRREERLKKTQRA